MARERDRMLFEILRAPSSSPRRDQGDDAIEKPESEEDAVWMRDMLREIWKDPGLSSGAAPGGADLDWALSQESDDDGDFIAGLLGIAAEGERDEVLSGPDPALDDILAAPTAEGPRKGRRRKMADLSENPDTTDLLVESGPAPDRDDAPEAAPAMPGGRALKVKRLFRRAMR